MPRRPADTSRPHYNVIFAVLLIGVSAYAVLQSLVAPVLATFITALHTTQDTATWLMTAYLLAASVATPILGRIGDKVGKERMLTTTPRYDDKVRRPLATAPARVITQATKTETCCYGPLATLRDLSQHLDQAQRRRVQQVVEDRLADDEDQDECRYLMRFRSDMDRRDGE